MDAARDGLDLHVMVLKHVSDVYGSAGGHTIASQQSQQRPMSMQSDEMDQIHGLVIFNQESASTKNAQGKTALKYVIHHVSSLKTEKRALMLGKTLEYLWKHTHCAAVKINLYHFSVMKKKPGAKEATPTMDADADLKAMLKQLRFKWKCIKNGERYRYETQELANAEYGDQMRQSKAAIYRRGLTREDVLKEPLTIFFSSMVAFGNSKRDNKSELLLQYQPA